MSIHEASALVGVSSATLRRWSDAGAVKAFTTPGGHRRFSPVALLGLLPAERRRRPNLERLGETPERIARAYRLDLQGTTRLAPWIVEFDDAEREPLRQHGRVIAAALLGFLDAPTAEAREAAIAMAEAAAAECGRIAGRRGLAIRQTVEASLRFRMPFIHELAGMARRWGLDTPATTDLLETATQALDRLLIAAMRGHEAAVRSEPVCPTVVPSEHDAAAAARQASPP
jgi:excisionase family DNA binding protein